MVYISRPEIPIDDFLMVFVLGALVIIFGAAYVGVFTFVKIKKLKNYFLGIAYGFWVALTYCLYTLGHMIGSQDFTMKVLMISMFAYLFFPHFIYFLMEQSHENHEH